MSIDTLAKTFVILPGDAILPLGLASDLVDRLGSPPGGPLPDGPLSGGSLPGRLDNESGSLGGPEYGLLGRFDGGEGGWLGTGLFGSFLIRITVDASDPSGVSLSNPDTLHSSLVKLRNLTESFLLLGSGVPG